MKSYRCNPKLLKELWMWMKSETVWLPWVGGKYPDLMPTYGLGRIGPWSGCRAIPGSRASWAEPETRNTEAGGQDGFKELDLERLNYLTRIIFKNPAFDSKFSVLFLINRCILCVLMFQLYFIYSIMSYFNGYTVLSLGNNYELVLKHCNITPAIIITDLSIPLGDSAKTGLCTYWAATFHPSPALANTILFSAFVSSTTFNRLCKLNHGVFVLLWLAYYT